MVRVELSTFLCLPEWGLLSRVPQRHFVPLGPSEVFRALRLGISGLRLVSLAVCRGSGRFCLVAVSGKQDLTLPESEMEDSVN